MAMANIWINFIILSLVGVISQVKCETETFGEVTDRLVLKENVVVKRDLFKAITVVINYPGKDTVSHLLYSI